MMRVTARIGFLFLGETLLIPHLFPIAEALAEAGEGPIDLWVSTSVHEQLLGRWIDGLKGVAIRRAPGFRTLAGYHNGRNPPLPAKLPMLTRLAPKIWRTPVVVCAEQTSLWLPRLLPMPARFVKTAHGAGSMSARDDPRRRAATLTLAPGEPERQALITRGLDPARVVVTGYVKAGFRQRMHVRLPFAETRPIILYTPHWQRHRSSWWAWGEQIVRRIIADGRFNLIFAPHQRLVEGAPELRALSEEIGRLPNVHCDLDSFAMIDGSYIAAADIYLGDTSSQVVEFLMRPRPCVFLNPQATPWEDDPAYAMWRCGEVVGRCEEALSALARAPVEHPRYATFQTGFAHAALGDVSGTAPLRAAAAISALLA